MGTGRLNHDELFNGGPAVVDGFALLTEIYLRDADAAVIKKFGDLQQVFAFAFAPTKGGGGVAEGVGVDVFGLAAGGDEAAFDDAVDHAAADGAVGVEFGRVDVGQAGGAVAVDGLEDVVVWVDGFEPSGDAEEGTDCMKGGRGEFFGPHFVAFAAVGVVAAVAVFFDVSPSEAGDFDGAAAGVEVGADEGEVAGAGEGLLVDECEGVFDGVGADGAAVAVGVDALAVRSLKGVGARVAVAVDEDGAFDVVAADEGEFFADVGVEGAEGGELAVDGGGLCALLFEFLHPCLGVEARDHPWGFGGEVEKLMEVAFVGGDGVGAAGFAALGVEPGGEGSSPGDGLEVGVVVDAGDEPRCEGGRLGDLVLHGGAASVMRDASCELRIALVAVQAVPVVVGAVGVEVDAVDLGDVVVGAIGPGMTTTGGLPADRADACIVAPDPQTGDADPGGGQAQKEECAGGA